MHLHSASEEWHRRPGSFDWDSAQVDSETVQLRLELESTHARLTMSREVRTLWHIMLNIRDNAWQGCMEEDQSSAWAHALDPRPGRCPPGCSAAAR